MIRRSERRQSFTTLDNRIFDAGLSFRALGLLTYLLSKPDNWEVSVAQLTRYSAQTKRPDGRDSVYAIIAELTEAGFVRRVVSRDGGKMTRHAYEVSETPFDSSPLPAKAEMASPLPALPDTVNPEVAPLTAEPTVNSAVSPLPALPYPAEPTQVNTEVKQRLKEEENYQEKRLPVAKATAAAKDLSDDDSEKSTTAELQQTCRETWAAYATAYAGRYQVDPVRNAKVNKMVVNLVKRLGKEAQHVAAFYLTHNGNYYVGKMHDFGPLLADAEKLRTEWATNTRMTATRARQIDGTQSNFDAVEQAKTMLRQRASHG